MIWVTEIYSLTIEREGARYAIYYAMMWNIYVRMYSMYVQYIYVHTSRHYILFYFPTGIQAFLFRQRCILLKHNS
jgi:hypothetical protein